MSISRNRLIIFLLLSLAGTVVACAVRQTQEEQIMKPAITYLYLLRTTPFYTELNTRQLKWVIQHSKEWEVQEGGVIVSPRSTGDSGGYWVLLDGGWALQYSGKLYHSGHADAGKWFKRDLIPAGDAELVATEHSYVMHIADKDMTEMLNRGFSLQHHLTAGKTYYSSLVAANVQADGTGD